MKDKDILKAARANKLRFLGINKFEEGYIIKIGDEKYPITDESYIVEYVKSVVKRLPDYHKSKFRKTIDRALHAAGRAIVAIRIRLNFLHRD